MYAVIKTGGKQYRVREGERLAVERLADAVAPEQADGGDAEVAEGASVAFTPILVVDGETVISDRAALAGAAVTGRLVGRQLGPKVRGFTYKPKTRRRRRWGHRQTYSVVEITSISKG